MRAGDDIDRMIVAKSGATKGQNVVFAGLNVFVFHSDVSVLEVLKNIESNDEGDIFELAI